MGPPFVAFGDATLRAYSPDGKTWTVAPSPSPLPAGWTGTPQSGDNQWLLRGGCYGAGLFVAVGGTGGDQGLLLTSTDGQTWSVNPMVQANDDCAYGNGVFVTATRYSSDGMTWNRATNYAPSCRRIAFGNGVFVAVGDQGPGAVSYTQDGKSWTTLATSFTGSDMSRKGYTSIAFGNGHFLAINSSIGDAPIFEWDGASASSFTETAMPSLLQGAARYAVVFGRGAFYIASDDSLFKRDETTKTWTKLQGSGAQQLLSLVVTTDVISNPQWWTTDGAQWQPATGATVLNASKVVGVSR